MRNSLQKLEGSLAARAESSHITIAESFVNADHIIVVDTSGSMEQTDAVRDGLRISRYRAACLELGELQKRLPGKLAVISFSSRVEFCPGGIPTLLADSTDLTKALDFVYPADGLVESFVVISDGQPDNPTTALQVAGTFQSRIDTVYVGPEGGSGQQFLSQLAQKTRGSSMTAAQTKELAATVSRLLTAQ